MDRRDEVYECVLHTQDIPQRHKEGQHLTNYWGLGVYVIAKHMHKYLFLMKYYLELHPNKIIQDSDKVHRQNCIVLKFPLHI